MITEILIALWQTFYMVLVSGILAIILGLPLGILLLTTREHHLYSIPSLNRILSIIINALRSLPFIILMIAIIPLTRFIVGTSIGTAAAIVPLVAAAFPFVARIVENALDAVPHGLTEASLSMGASSYQIIQKVLIPEALPALVNGITLMFITLIGYSAMAGAVGGGGLGDLAIRYGYQRFDVNIMIITVLILIVMVQCIQWLGDKTSQQLLKVKR